MRYCAESFILHIPYRFPTILSTPAQGAVAPASPSSAPPAAQPIAEHVPEEASNCLCYNSFTMSAAGQRLETREAAIVDERRQQGTLLWLLFAVVCVTLAFVMTLLGSSLYLQYKTYNAGVSASLNAPQIDHASVIAYSRALDFAIAKTSAICLGFLLIFVGALYVLRTADTHFGLGVDAATIKASLQTSSPGLVMITLGVVLVGTALINKSDVDYKTAPAADIGGQAYVGVAPAPLSKSPAIEPSTNEPSTPSKVP